MSERFEYWKNTQGNYAAYSLGRHNCGRNDGHPCGDENCNIVNDKSHKRIIRVADWPYPERIAQLLADHGFHRVEE